MATQKVVLIFDDNAAGWSEDFYLLDRDPDPDLSLAAGRGVADLRARFLAKGGVGVNGVPGPFVRAIRISNVNNPNQSGLFPPTPQNIGLSAGNPVGMMGTRTAVLSMYTANKEHVRRFGVRGLPAAWLSGDLNDRVSPPLSAPLLTMTTAFNAFFRGAEFGQWGMRVAPWVAPLGASNVVSTVSVSPTTGRWVITAPFVAPPLSLTQRVSIQGFRGDGLNGLNRPAKIVRIDAITGAYELSTRSCSRCAIKIKQYGRIYVPGAVTYQRFTEVKFSGYGQRATGRNFFPPPGRPKKRACCAR